MKPKTLVLLAVAGGCGLVAMLGVQQAMQQNHTPAKVQTTKVLVALENIETGMRLTADNVTFKELPTGSLPEDAVQTEQDYVQRAAKVPLVAGDVVRKSKLTEQGDWGKSVAIPKGMRVVSIPVDDTHTISGLLRPGDRVDVLVTYQGRGDRGTTVSKTKTLLEYVEVFATDDHTAAKLDEKSGTSRAKNVALLLNPEQTQFLTIALNKGKLSLSWRRKGDDELTQTKDVDEKLMEELEGTVGAHDGDMPLYGRRGNDFVDGETPRSASQFLDHMEQQAATPAPAVVQAPPANVWTIEIYNGNEAVPQHFELPNDKPASPAELSTPDDVQSQLEPLTSAKG